MQSAFSAAFSTEKLTAPVGILIEKGHAIRIRNSVRKVFKYSFQSTFLSNIFHTINAKQFRNKEFSQKGA